MISLARVDDRLMHGQITVGWAPFLDASGIVVVSDRLAANPVLASILKVGGPAGVFVEVVSVEDTVALSRLGSEEEGKCILLFESLSDVQLTVAAGLSLRSLNLGGLRGQGEGRRVSEAVFLSPADEVILRDLRRRGIEVELRIMPGDKRRFLPESGQE